MRMSAPASIMLGVGITALSACSPAQPQSDERAAAQVPQPPSPLETGPTPASDNCLLVVWQDQKTRDEQFDLAHDSASGGAISCATGTSASQFANAFTAIRNAARAQDKAAILNEVGLPLLYIDANGKRRKLTASDDVDAAFSEVFDDNVLALLRNVDLDALTVVPDQGAFVRLGSVWLVVDRSGGRPRIVTVNKQALGEAADAVRAKAEAQRPPAERHRDRARAQLLAARRTLRRQQAEEQV